MTAIVRPAVLARWRAFNVELEGISPHLYLDVLGLVTCAMGVLVDHPTNPTAGLDMALQLPWRTPDGSLATPAEIEAQWRAVRSNQALKEYRYPNAAKFLKERFGYVLTLSDADMDAITERKLMAKAEDIVREDFPEFPSWPADAQIATLSMAWAAGEDIFPKFTKFSEHARARNWAGCAVECRLNPYLPPEYPPNHPKANPGLDKRNALNRAHFEEAAYWATLDDPCPDQLHGPCTLQALRSGWVTAADLDARHRQLIGVRGGANA